MNRSRISLFSSRNHDVLYKKGRPKKSFSDFSYNFSIFQKVQRAAVWPPLVYNIIHLYLIGYINYDLLCALRSACYALSCILCLF